MRRWRSSTRTERRKNAERHGHRGEALAALFLQAKFYRLRDRRFKTPVGELDLVTEKGGTIVFVEVKARGRYTDEALALGAVNRSRITRAAQYWLARHPGESGKDIRFDVIFLASRRWPRHLINAFPAI
ncbi:YraN family protein [Devosia sp. YIM 151766]|uniref:YraN family protein n=1 Tax=Devosia sp. YIM 151766 TaxID=3017325 RepID=UPI00255CE675|nr:YraN family protein [Devosia sp. YIM 151766]WIY52870.1 YraN family protein [Devosia sp. YIM 151766]